MRQLALRLLRRWWLGTHERTLATYLAVIGRPSTAAAALERVRQTLRAAAERAHSFIP